MKTVHSVKCWTVYFNRIISRLMEFQIRLNDRNYQPGDIIRNEEFDPSSGTYTKRVAICRVTCVISDLPGLQPGYVALGHFFEKLESSTNTLNNGGH
jgi:hypothetical protein